MMMHDAQQRCDCWCGECCSFSADSLEAFWVWILCAALPTSCNTQTLPGCMQILCSLLHSHQDKHPQTAQAHAHTCVHKSLLAWGPMGACDMPVCSAAVVAEAAVPAAKKSLSIPAGLFLPMLSPGQSVKTDCYTAASGSLLAVSSALL